MRKVCAWCKCDMGEVSGSLEPEAEFVSHGLCNSCGSQLFSQMGVQLHEYLNTIGAPIAVVNDRGLIQTINVQARTLLNKELAEIEDKPGGDVLDCIHATSPAGCGNTPACETCTVRSIVMDTFQTGQSHVQVPACLTRRSGTGRRRKTQFVISTERVANIVLLRIDELRDDPPC